MYARVVVGGCYLFREVNSCPRALFGHVSRFHQSRARENIWGIIKANNARSQPITAIWWTNFEMERLLIRKLGNLLRKQCQKASKSRCVLLRVLFRTAFAFAVRWNIWRKTKAINYFWLRKYARIVVRGYYLFWEVNSCQRAKLEGNCELCFAITVKHGITTNLFVNQIHNSCSQNNNWKVEIVLKCHIVSCKDKGISQVWNDFPGRHTQ